MNREIIELIDHEATSYISANRDSRPHPGHEITHLRNVAQLTELAGIAAGFAVRDIELARIIGWFHDFARSSNETKRETDEKLSCQAMLGFMRSLQQRSLYQAAFTEKEAMVHAILENSRPPEFFSLRPNPANWDLNDRLLGALFTADKLEQNGVWVIARRSQFVAGARLHGDPNEEDLPKYGLRPFRDEVKAVLLESAVRIAFINPEGIYPAIFRPLTAKMYDPQRDFIHGLLATQNMTIDDYAEMILNTRSQVHPRHPNYLQARYPYAPKNPAELAIILYEVGGLENWRTHLASQDLAGSSLEAVSYFSSQYQLPLEQLIRGWNPTHHTSRLWHESMLKYVNGDWFDQTRNQLAQRIN